MAANIGISTFPCVRVGFMPIALFQLHHWPSVLRKFVFLRGPGAAKLDLLRKLMIYLMARPNRARRGDDLFAG